MTLAGFEALVARRRQLAVAAGVVFVLMVGQSFLAYAAHRQADDQRERIEKALAELVKFETGYQERAGAQRDRIEAALAEVLRDASWLARARGEVR